MNPSTRIFSPHGTAGYHDALPGIQKKTLVWGKTTLMAEFLLAAGSILPAHSHPHEQTGYLVRGHMTLTIGEDRFDVVPGDSWNIPSSVEHNAEIHEDSVAIEIFSPVREDYLPL